MKLDIDKIVNPDYLDKQIEKLKNFTIFIYGAGSFGKEICVFLENKDIKIKGFFDQKASKLNIYCGYQVYSLYENFGKEIKENALILFSIVMDKDERKSVLNEIRRAGYKNIKEAQFYRSLQIVPDEKKITNYKLYFTESKEKISYAYSLLKDEKSKNIFCNNIKALFQKDYSECELWEDSMDEQYFPEDIVFAKGYSRFIDCGGYIGDTVECLIRKKAEVESIITFEPDIYNFKILSQNKMYYKCEMFCFPCAVSDSTGVQNFNSARGSGMLSEKGESNILTIALDDVLQEYKPTFIKMDIEGAELRAINGAKRVIIQNIPDLAICVYHNINHIWDVIILLNSWNLGYKFYLRNYNSYTMETVLYATIGEE